MHSMRSRFIENCPREADSKEDENNMNDTNLTIRPMKIDDFEQVHSLWMEIHGFGIRSIDDSKEGVERFIRRNPTTSMVAVCDGKLSVQSSAGMMAGEQDFIMSVYRKITENTESGRNSWSGVSKH